MVQLGEAILERPEILAQIPAMMAQQIREQQADRNPFDRGEQYFAEFAAGWSLGYSAGTILPAAASGGGSLAGKVAGQSRKFQKLLDAADLAVPDRVPNGVRLGVLRRAGVIDDRLFECSGTSRLPRTLTGRLRP
ncbi:hypothetical protein GBQ70_04235 [Halomicrobium sp. ZPS1]|nr:hypothetical protein [Halomicrobium sp. ZPS1]QCD67079.1 hypothetical protein E5139_04240 [Halomicrobium mukohataei]QFR21888.1 hypothetical protein GBQ70_04235 [Halomicrobium sp. ZPS1]